MENWSLLNTVWIWIAFSSKEYIPKADLWPSEDASNSFSLHPYALQENQPIYFLYHIRPSGVSFIVDSSCGFASCFPWREGVKPFSSIFFS